MTAFNGVPFTYDANGNLISNGTNTYVWDARNHLVSLSGGNAASFVYDPFGRRAQKTINGVSTQFLYDASNPVQEIQNGAPSANLLSGVGIDEYFQRTDSARARNYLTDILGSTLALTDAAGNMQTQYSYDPFGNAAASGQASSNAYQFTGRENDSTGLYYYRARYQSPSLARFIAQDPIEFGSSDKNAYSYVSNRPTALRDPTGKQEVINCQENLILCHDPPSSICDINPAFCTEIANAVENVIDYCLGLRKPHLDPRDPKDKCLDAAENPYLWDLFCGDLSGAQYLGCRRSSGSAEERRDFLQLSVRLGPD